MTIKFSEAGGSNPRPVSKGIFEAKIIQTGWNASGTRYYSEDLLKTYGPSTFREGRPCFANHPTDEEFSNGRNVEKIMGRLVSDAEYREGALYAKVKVRPEHIDFIEEYKDSIGMSIFASGEGENGEAEGRKGLLVESFDPGDPYTSVDFVVAAGAGGKIERMLESYRATIDESETHDRKEKGMTPEDIKAVATALVEALAPALTEIREAVKPAAPVEAEPVEGATPAEVAEAVIAADLPGAARTRVFEALKNDPSADVTKVIEAEKTYAEALRNEVAGVEEEAPGRVRESATGKTDTYSSPWGR